MPSHSSCEYNVIDVTKYPGYIYDDNVTVWSKLFKRDIIPNEPFIINRNMEDLPFYCSLNLTQKCIAFCVENAGYGYRIRKGNITTSLERITPAILDIIDSCEYVISFAKLLGLNDESTIKAKDIYKKYMLLWLNKIDNWNLSDSKKAQFMKQYCAIANSIFGKVNSPEFYKKRDYSSTLCRYYDDLINEAGIVEPPHDPHESLKS